MMSKENTYRIPSPTELAAESRDGFSPEEIKMLNRQQYQCTRAEMSAEEQEIWDEIEGKNKRSKRRKPS